jgi:TetR/AcrR family transcriptional regulator
LGQVRDTRQHLIDAARMLLTERVVLDVSIAEVTQRAKANIALVSYHFGGREGLMLAIVRADAALALADLDRLLAADLTASEKMRRHITGIVRAYHQRPYLHRLLQKLIREGTHDAAEQVSSFFMKPVAQARRTIIDAGIASGEFRTVDPELISFALDGACAQIFASSKAREAVLGDGKMDEALLERYSQSTADLIVAGLRTSIA